MAARRFTRPEYVREETPAPAPVEHVEPVETPAPPAEEVVAAPAPLPVSGLVVVRVRGPGSIVTDAVHVAGEELVLNLTDAQSLGDAVEIVG